MGLSDPSESSDKFLCRPKDAAPCIDKSLGGPRITRENRSIDWRILITGHPTPDVRWTKADNPIDDHRVVMRSAEDMEGLVASLNIAKCKKSDAGLYKLTAENALGSDSLEIDLIVLDDLDGCECAMFSTADLACTCRHRYGQFTFTFSKATLLDDYKEILLSLDRVSFKQVIDL